MARANYGDKIAILYGAKLLYGMGPKADSDLGTVMTGPPHRDLNGRDEPI
jgi:hypothetical protein